MIRPLDLNDVRKYVETNIGEFHDKRLSGIQNLKLDKLLKRKNPYLFRAKNMLTAEQIVRNLLDAHISSNEETIFGDWLEKLAIFINEKVYGGRKSGIAGIDLEFDNDGVRYIVSIKSGPNWGNSSQIKKLEDIFRKAAKTLRTSNSNIQVFAVNGCCYGIDENPDKGGYLKYCGKRFWEFISNDPELYKNLIEPLGAEAKARNETFEFNYAQVVNRFTLDFAQRFCTPVGAIDWPALVAFNSAGKANSSTPPASAGAQVGTGG